MPFVPLGSRKRIEVILDDDKHKLSSDMQAKDNATVKLHHQHMPGATGYRYANHPETMGPVRGPPAPFRGANKPWSPPENDATCMAALKDLEHAPQGAFSLGSHAPLGETMRKTRSVPALVKTLREANLEEGGKTLGEQAKEKANPISIELSRWKRMAEVTKRDLASMPSIHPTKREAPPPKKPLGAGGLVNFPKYMLFENSHLKQQDLLRFIESEEKARQEVEARQRAAEEAMSRGEVQDTPPIESPMSTGRESTPAQSMGPMPGGQASWGAPRLRGPPDEIKHIWAGNPMPTGKSSKSSNPFRC